MVPNLNLLAALTNLGQISAINQKTNIESFKNHNLQTVLKNIEASGPLDLSSKKSDSDVGEAIAKIEEIEEDSDCGFTRVSV
jgi:hypothetical protein